jgi:hypothetical protein
MTELAALNMSKELAVTMNSTPAGHKPPPVTPNDAATLGKLDG